MKANVIKIFRDKETKKIHQIGEEIEVTKKRFEEINSTSFGIFVAEIEEEKEVAEPAKDKKSIEGESTGATENEESKKSEKKRSAKK